MPLVLLRGLATLMSMSRTTSLVGHTICGLTNKMGYINLGTGHWPSCWREKRQRWSRTGKTLFGGNLCEARPRMTCGTHATTHMQVQEWQTAPNYNIKALVKGRSRCGAAKPNISLKASPPTKDTTSQYKDSTYISWSGTCAVAVSTTKAMTLSWNQISTAFDTLYSLCIDGPVPGPRGGLATYSATSRYEVFGKKKKRADEITGLNAVPEGAVINVWKHADNASVPCELAAVLRGQPLDQCRKP